MTTPTDRRTIFRALLPMRLFLGITFLYAGIDKFLDPAFLQASGSGSIGEQLALYKLISPLAPLVTALGEPFAVEIGFLIAVGEIAIGLGTLSGILYRLSALGGLVLSVLFFLTVSFTTLPYYYGPDLPYGFAWLTLLVAGHGGVWVFDPFARLLAVGRDAEALGGVARPLPRREVVQAGALGIVSIALGIVASLSPFRRAPIGDPVSGDLPTGSAEPGPTPVASDTAHATADASQAVATEPAASLEPGATPGPTGTAAPGQSPGTTAGPGATPGPTPAPGSTATPAPTAAPTARPTATPAPTPAGTLIGTVSNVQSAGATTFKIPSDGHPGVLVALTNGSIGCWDAKCTHAGCTCAYQGGTKLLECPCHGALFDPNQGAKAVKGPATKPLVAKTIRIDPDGKIYLV